MVLRQLYIAHVCRAKRVLSRLRRSLAAHPDLPSRICVGPDYRHQADPAASFARGLAPFRHVFAQLRDIRPWNVADRIGNDIRQYWQERLDEQHLASPLLAEGRVYFFGKEGKTTVVQAGRPFEKLAENRLEGVVVATPAILDRTIFLRTDTHLYRIGKE